MSYDRYSIQHELTAAGWNPPGEPGIHGSPIEIWEQNIYQGSGFGRQSESWRCKWADPGFSEADRSALRTRFPFPGDIKITEEMMRQMLARI